MLGREQPDDGSRASLVRKLTKCVGHAADKAAVGLAQHEAQLRRDLQSGVGTACVVERPLH